MHISVEPVEETLKKQVDWTYQERGSNLLLFIQSSLVGEQVDIYTGDEYVLTVQVGKGGQIRIRKKSGIGKRVIRGIATKNLRVLL